MTVNHVAHDRQKAITLQHVAFSGLIAVIELVVVEIKNSILTTTQVKTPVECIFDYTIDKKLKETCREFLIKINKDLFNNGVNIVKKQYVTDEVFTLLNNINDMVHRLYRTEYGETENDNES